MGLVRGLGLWAATAIVIGAMIGQSVFLVASDMSRSFASFAHLRLQPPDLTELHVPFCAYKNSSGCRKTLAIRQTGPEIDDGVVPFCACAKRAAPRKLLKRFGVLDGI
jgi:hypothetical protein